jgi:hypothetical protein
MLIAAAVLVLVSGARSRYVSPLHNLKQTLLVDKSRESPTTTELVKELRFLRKRVEELEDKSKHADIINGGVTTREAIDSTSDAAGLLERLAGKVQEIELFMPKHCTAEDDVGCISIDFSYGQGIKKQGGGLKILCMVLSTKREHQIALDIKNTWGSKCDQLLFLADYDDPSLPAVDMKATWEGSGDCLIDKIFKGWQYVHDARLSGKLPDFNFVLKADVDSMPVMENVRKLLVEQEGRHYAGQPVYVGKRQMYYGRLDAQYNAG